MSRDFLLNWAIMAVSLFNTILLLWLGLTVLLNAERRTWGMWLAGGGLLMGAAFFVSHSAILGYGLHYAGPGTEFWWRVGWVPVVFLPCAWYVVMLWYSGYWDHPAGHLRRRQRPWLILTALLVVTFVVLFLVANPLPSYWQVARLDLAATPAIGGIPAVMLAYPLYVILCITLSLDALRQPEPSARVMGDAARRRARPWLTGTSVVLLAVSLGVAGVMFWIVSNARQRALSQVYPGMSGPIAWSDLAIASLIALAIVLLGQAISAYEVFTGHTLPRRGLVRHWRRAGLLAAGYGLTVGWSLAANLPPIYGLLLTTILMTLFYALLGWRSFVERERAMEQLRPFAAGPRLYDRLLAPSPAGGLDTDTAALFRTLCADVLGARLAYLAPLGPLASLAGPPLAYPEGSRLPPAALVAMTAEIAPSPAFGVPVDPATCGGATWAVPLRGEPDDWRAEPGYAGERSLAGVLLLGEKRDGGLYTQEEIEIARAGGERLVDTLASLEVARRLLALQRRRLAESRDYGELSRALFDQRARRLLHDEVLPALHTAMLSVHNARSSTGRAVDDPLPLLVDAHRQISDLLREMPPTAAPDLARLGLAGALAEIVSTELAGAFADVAWRVAEQAEESARALAPLPAEVIFYAAREAMRNAARHGHGPASTRPLHLSVEIAWHEQPGRAQDGWLGLVVHDDGVGLPREGRSAAGGRGLGLHTTMMAIVGGALEVESVPGAGTRVTLTLPASRGAAVPAAAVERGNARQKALNRRAGVE